MERMTEWLDVTSWEDNLDAIGFSTEVSDDQQRSLVQHQQPHAPTAWSPTSTPSSSSAPGPSPGSGPLTAGSVGDLSGVGAGDRATGMCRTGPGAPGAGGRYGAEAVSSVGGGVGVGRVLAATGQRLPSSPRPGARATPPVIVQPSPSPQHQHQPMQHQHHQQQQQGYFQQQNRQHFRQQNPQDVNRQSPCYSPPVSSIAGGGYSGTGNSNNNNNNNGNLSHMNLQLPSVETIFQGQEDDGHQGQRTYQELGQYAGPMGGGSSGGGGGGHAANMADISMQQYSAGSNNDNNNFPNTSQHYGASPPPPGQHQHHHYQMTPHPIPCSTNNTTCQVIVTSPMLNTGVKTENFPLKPENYSPTGGSCWGETGSSPPPPMLTHPHQQTTFGSPIGANFAGYPPSVKPDPDQRLAAAGVGALVPSVSAASPGTSSDGTPAKKPHPRQGYRRPTNGDPRKERRREQNRRAALKCRMKKKDEWSELHQDYGRLERENAELQQKINTLEEEKRKLVELLRSHQQTCSLQVDLPPPSTPP